MERRSPRNDRPAEPEASPRSIVVLDADPRSRALVEEILTAEMYRVASTGDPSAAITKAQSEGADIVLADMGMRILEAVPRWERRRSDPELVVRTPVKSGYAILRALQADPSAARYPAVYVTQHQSYRFGVVDYVSKPIDARLLRERIEEVFVEIEAGAEAPGRAAAQTRSSSPVFAPRPAPRSAAPAQPHPPSAEGGVAWPSLTASPQLAAPAIEMLPKGLRTALVVDGDAGARAFLRDLLLPYDFTVHEATDGEAGLEVALKYRPWLILSEVNMPGMDGFEFCRRVRAHAVTRYTPLIFFSAWDDYRERYLGIKLGGDDYLTKGTSPREILIRVQLILKRYSDVGTRTRRGAGLEGGIGLIGAPGMLQMCHLGRFSGVCTVRSGTRRVQFRFREGEIVSAESARSKGAQAVFEFLAWTEGHFEFVPGDPGDEAPLPEAFDYLLLEGCRRLDDQRRLAEEDTDPGAPAPEGAGRSEPV